FSAMGLTSWTWSVSGSNRNRPSPASSKRAWDRSVTVECLIAGASAGCRGTGVVRGSQIRGRFATSNLVWRAGGGGPLFRAPTGGSRPPLAARPLDHDMAGGGEAQRLAVEGELAQFDRGAGRRGQEDGDDPTATGGVPGGGSRFPVRGEVPEAIRRCAPG